eukprot:gene50410-51620_t
MAVLNLSAEVASLGTLESWSLMARANDEAPLGDPAAPAHACAPVGLPQEELPPESSADAALVPQQQSPKRTSAPPTGAVSGAGDLVTPFDAPLRSANLVRAGTSASARSSSLGQSALGVGLCRRRMAVVTCGAPHDAAEGAHDTAARCCALIAAWEEEVRRQRGGVEQLQGLRATASWDCARPERREQWSSVITDPCPLGAGSSTGEVLHGKGRSCAAARLFCRLRPVDCVADPSGGAAVVHELLGSREHDLNAAAEETAAFAAEGGRGWGELHHDGFAALVDGRRAEAVSLLQEHLSRHPGDGVAAR